MRPAIVDWQHMAAHYAVSSLFEEPDQQPKVHAHTVDFFDYQGAQAGRSKLAVGRAGFTSDITRESALLTFGVLHFGDHNVNCGVRRFQGEDAYRAMLEELTEAFKSADFPEVIRLMDKHFGESSYSLRSLFRDEQRKVFQQIVDSILAETEAAHRHLYTEQVPLMRFMTTLGVPIPRAFYSTTEFFLNADLRRAMTSEVLDVEWINGLLQEAATLTVDLDSEDWAISSPRTWRRRHRASPTAPRTSLFWHSSETEQSLPAHCPSRWTYGEFKTRTTGCFRASTLSSRRGPARERVRQRSGSPSSSPWEATSRYGSPEWTDCASP